MNPEKALFDAFILPARKQRYIEIIDTKRGRERIRLGLIILSISIRDSAKE